MTKRNLKIILFIYPVVIVMCLISLVTPAYGISPEQKKLLEGGVLYSDYEDSCLPVSQTPQGGSLYMIGDSITVGMRDAGDLKNKLTGAGFSVKDIEATEGITVSKSLEKINIDADLVKQSQTIVIALGTNKENSFGDRVKEMIDKIRSYSLNAQIYWINTYAPGYDYNDINSALTTQSGALKFNLIDWQKEASANQAKYKFTDVHSTPDGYKARADFVVSSLKNPAQPFGAVPISTETISGTNRGYNGQEVFTAEDLKKIEQNKSVYTTSAQANDVPWQLIAVIHKRESNLGRKNPSNGQGVFQFYNDGNFYPPGEVDEAEFLRQANILAKRLQQDYSTRNHPKNIGPLKATGTPDNVIKDTLFSYNGRADVYKRQASQLGFTDPSQGFEGSPYVMNKADAKRDPDVAPRGTWGQIKSDGGSIVYPANKDWGAWPQFAALAGISGDASSSSCGQSAAQGSSIVIDGYAYPMGPLKKSEISPPPPCNKASCHHDNTPAFDLFAKGGADKTAGSPVYAISDGVVKNVKVYKGIEGCYSFQFFSSKDNFYYW